MTPQSSVGAAYREIGRRLARAGMDSAGLDARLLVGTVIGGGATEVLGYPERGLSPEEEERLEGLVARRLRREPMALILGRREFWRHEFRVTADTLVPRPDSETLIEAALEYAQRRQKPQSILDLGTGTGCLLLSLLGEFPEAWGVGVDISPAALSVAAANARDLGMAARAKFVLGNWGQTLDGRFDLIIANPPYIADKDISSLMPEVAEFEPRIALTGGGDGLSCYREIAPRLAVLTAPGGRIILEVGFGQAPQVVDILSKNHVQLVDIKSDLSGVARCIVAKTGDDRAELKKRVGMKSVSD